MNKNTKKSLILSLVGLIVLYSSSIYISPAKTDIKDIKPSWIGKNVIIQGKITSTQKINDTLIMDLEASDSIKVVKFGSEKVFKQGSTVEVEGVVKMYRGNLEVVGDEISRLNIDQN